MFYYKLYGHLEWLFSVVILPLTMGQKLYLQPYGGLEIYFQTGNSPFHHLHQSARFILSSFRARRFHYLQTYWSWVYLSQECDGWHFTASARNFPSEALSWGFIPTVTVTFFFATPRVLAGRLDGSMHPVRGSKSWVPGSAHCRPLSS